MIITNDHISRDKKIYKKQIHLQLYYDKYYFKNSLKILT